MIRDYHDSGTTTGLRDALAILAPLSDRLGRHESSATIASFAVSPLAAAGHPELTTAIAHLRDVLATRPTNRSPARASR